MNPLPPLPAQDRTLNRMGQTADAYASVMAKSADTLRAEANSLEDLAAKYARDAETLAESSKRTRLQVIMMAGDYAWRALLFRDAADQKDAVRPVPEKAA